MTEVAVSKVKQVFETYVYA